MEDDVLQLEQNTTLLRFGSPALDRPRASNTKYDNALPDGRSKAVSKNESPQLPTEPFWQDVVTQGWVVWFNVPVRHRVSQLVMQHFSCTAVYTELYHFSVTHTLPNTNFYTYNAAVWIRISKSQEARAHKEAAPDKHKNVVAPPRLTEYWSKVDKSAVVEELEQNNQRDNFCFIVVAQQPPLCRVNSTAVEFVADKPILLEKPDDALKDNDDVWDISSFALLLNLMSSYLPTMNQKLIKTTPRQEANVCGPTGLAVGRDGPSFFAGRACVIANVINVVMKPRASNVSYNLKLLFFEKKYLPSIVIQIGWYAMTVK